MIIFGSHDRVMWRKSVGLPIHHNRFHVIKPTFGIYKNFSYCRREKKTVETITDVWKTGEKKVRLISTF